MNRIERAFQNKPIFMPYFPLGYPDLDTSIDVIETLAKHGADLVILGIRPPARSIGLLTHVSHSTAQNIVAYATCPVLTVRG